MSTLKERDAARIAGTYKRFPLEIVSGAGSLVYDESGREYIDLSTGIAVNSFGVADEVWRKAVIEQIGRVQHTSNLYYTEPCVRLAEMLCERTGMDKVFFSNSGAEANECAIKVARKWASERKGIAEPVIATLENSFHGRTITTLAATGQDHYHELFQPLTPGFVHIAPEDETALAALAGRDDLAAVMIECVQGEGGVVALSEGYVRALERFVAENDVLLIIDEVQTGNGRTGDLYAFMGYGLEPDIVSTAKGLAGGLPLGATLLAERVSDVLGFGDHGSTFGGNPVSCAAAVSVLERIDDALLAEVREKAALIRSELAGADGIKGVSGRGLMVGIETVRPAPEVIAACMEKGVLVIAAKDRVRLLPALNIPVELLIRALDVIKECCAA